MNDGICAIGHKHVTEEAHLFTVTGVLTIGAAGELVEALVDAAGEGRELVVDVSDVRATEADALTVLLEGIEGVEHLGGELLLAARDPWWGEYVVAPLKPEILEQAATVIPELEAQPR
jgi:hypothetical protein